MYIKTLFTPRPGTIALHTIHGLSSQVIPFRKLSHAHTSYFASSSPLTMFGKSANTSTSSPLLVWLQEYHYICSPHRYCKWLIWFSKQNGELLKSERASHSIGFLYISIYSVPLRSKWAGLLQYSYCRTWFLAHLRVENNVIIANMK